MENNPYSSCSYCGVEHKFEENTKFFFFSCGRGKLCDYCYQKYIREIEEVEKKFCKGNETLSIKESQPYLQRIDPIGYGCKMQKDI